MENLIFFFFCKKICPTYPRPLTPCFHLRFFNKKKKRKKRKKKEMKKKKRFFSSSYSHIFILFLSIFISSKIHLCLLFVFFIRCWCEDYNRVSTLPKCIHSIFYVHFNLLHVLQWIITVVQYQNPKYIYSVCIYTVSIPTQHV